jgi:hypothetical protein
MEIIYGNYIWKSYMEIIYGNYIWKSYMKIIYGNYIWKFTVKVGKTPDATTTPHPACPPSPFLRLLTAHPRPALRQAHPRRETKTINRITVIWRKKLDISVRDLSNELQTELSLIGCILHKFAEGFCSARIVSELDALEQKLQTQAESQPP